MKMQFVVLFSAARRATETGSAISPCKAITGQHYKNSHQNQRLDDRFDEDDRSHQRRVVYLAYPRESLDTLAWNLTCTAVIEDSYSGANCGLSG